MFKLMILVMMTQVPTTSKRDYYVKEYRKSDSAAKADKVKVEAVRKQKTRKR